MATHEHCTIEHLAEVFRQSQEEIISEWRLQAGKLLRELNLNKPTIIDPRQVLGNWQTATFYPTNTLPSRSNKETTTVFVTSSRPFGEALQDSREFVR